MFEDIDKKDDYEFGGAGARTLVDHLSPSDEEACEAETTPGSGNIIHEDEGFLFNDGCDCDCDCDDDDCDCDGSGNCAPGG